MKAAACLLGVFVSAISLSTAIGADSELARLQKSYTEAAEKALAPVKETYIRELQKLFEQQTRTGRVDDSLAVKVEIERLTGKPPADAAAPNTTTLPELRKKITHDRFIFYFDGPRSKTMTFGSDGKIEEGGNPSEFKWKLDGEELLIYNNKEQLSHSLKYDRGTDTFVKGPRPSLWMSKNIRMENAPKK